MKFLLPLCLVLLSTVALADKYKNFAELAASETLGVDYQIEVQDKNSSVSLFAPHGGLIERGSSELLKAVAGSEFNQYHFLGMKTGDNFSLHITSANFDEPQALKLAQKSQECLSFHGYIGKGENAICIGGGNKTQAKKLADLLQASNLGFEVLYPCVKYPGEHKTNIVNLCQNQGVQLEMSSVFRDRILADENFKQNLAEIIKKSLVH